MSWRLGRASCSPAGGAAAAEAGQPGAADDAARAAAGGVDEGGLAPVMATRSQSPRPSSHWRPHRARGAGPAPGLRARAAAGVAVAGSGGEGGLAAVGGSSQSPYPGCSEATSRPPRRPARRWRRGGSRSRSGPQGGSLLRSTRSRRRRPRCSRRPRDARHARVGGEVDADGGAGRLAQRQHEAVGAAAGECRGDGSATHVGAEVTTAHATAYAAPVKVTAPVGTLASVIVQSVPALTAVREGDDAAARRGHP